MSYIQGPDLVTETENNSSISFPLETFTTAMIAKTIFGHKAIITEVINSPSSIDIKINGDDCGILQYYKFIKKNDLWLLVAIEDLSM